MLRTSRFLIAAVMAMSLGTGLAACGSSTSSSDTTQVGQIELTPVSNLIDVRSAEEFATGAITGARNFNLENGYFEKALSSLDKEASYSVYCRSGRRSAIAVEMMKKAGFTNVTDLGGIEEAAQALALPITKK